MGDLDFPSIKYGTIDFVKNHTNQYIRNLLDIFPIVGNHKNILVDVKVHNLKEGERPTLPNWHIDCVTHPLDPRKEEVHHIFVSGNCLTEFLEEDLIIDLPSCKTITNFNRFCDGARITNIPRDQIVTYGRLPHRGAICKVAETRLLIRVTESDILKPKNIIFEPTKRPY